MSVPHEIQDWVGKQLFDSVPSNIIVIDRDYRVVLSNQSFRRLFGATEGRYCYEIHNRRDNPCPNCKAAQCFTDGRVYTTDESGYDRDGRPAHYTVQMAPIRDSDGQIVHVIEMSHDVTESHDIGCSYNLLFDRVPCYVTVLDRNLRVVRSNDLIRRVFGATEGERCYRLYKDRDGECEDCPARKTFADGQMHTAKQVGADKNGARTCFVVSTAALASNGQQSEFVIEMALDITAQEKLSAELVRESRFRHLLTETAMDPVVATDIADLVTIFNPAAEKLFGRAAADVVGKMTGESILPHEYASFLRGLENTLEAPDTRIIARSGEEIPVRFCGTVLREGSEVFGSAVFLEDQRERKRLEQERLDNERLVAVGQTVAQLAHGIKNILTGIQGGMYALKTGLKRGST
ncbi:MAG: PAS domain-containing protein, partial [Pseudomonadota bacterium]